MNKITNENFKLTQIQTRDLILNVWNIIENQILSNTISIQNISLIIKGLSKDNFYEEEVLMEIARYIIFGRNDKLLNCKPLIKTGLHSINSRIYKFIKNIENIDKFEWSREKNSKLIIHYKNNEIKTVSKDVNFGVFDFPFLYHKK